MQPAEGGQPLDDQLFQRLASKQSCVPPMPNQSKHPYRPIHNARKYEIALDPLLSKAAIGIPKHDGSAGLDTHDDHSQFHPTNRHALAFNIL